MDNYTAQSPQLVVAGRFLTGEEEERWQRVLRDPVLGLLRVILVILLCVFSIQGAGLAAASDWRMPLVVFPLEAACFCFLIVWARRIRRRKQQAQESVWLDRWQDTKTVRAGCMISLYRDRAVYSTMRGSSVLHFDDVTHFCETEDGIAIGNARFTICFRGMDLTSAELVAVRRFLQQGGIGSRYSLKAATIPRRVEPLPHVRFANYDTVITRAAVMPTEDKYELSELLGIILPQMILYSLVPAFMIAPTPLPLLNCVIFGVVFALVGVLLTYLARFLKKRDKTPVRLAFTKDGIARQQAGVVTFAVRGRYAMRTSENGMTVYFTNGEQLEIPWESAEDAEALKHEFS